MVKCICKFKVHTTRHIIYFFDVFADTTSERNYNLFNVVLSTNTSKLNAYCWTVCKCIMHKRCLVTGATPAPVAGVPEEDASSVAVTQDTRNAGDQGPAEAVQYASGDRRGAGDARDADDIGPAETVRLSTSLTWVGKKDAGTVVVVVAKVELEIGEQYHVMAVTWQLEQRLWDRLIGGRVDVDTVAAAGYECKTSWPQPQDALPVAGRSVDRAVATMVHGYTAKTAGERATAAVAANHHHFRTRRSLTRMVTTSGRPPVPTGSTRAPLLPSERPVGNVVVLGPLPVRRRFADIFSAAAGHRSRLANMLVEPVVTLAVKAPPPPPPSQQITAFGKSTRATMSEKNIPLFVGIQKEFIGNSRL